jgi:Zn-dependent M28 family amino/carboxypeptidase
MKLAISLAGGLLAAATAVAVQAAPAGVERYITADLLRAHVRFLSADFTEGRGVASRGEEIAMSYIASQMEALGLQPGAPDGGWLQKFDVVGITSTLPRGVTFTGKGGKLKLNYHEEFIGFSGVQAEQASVEDAEVVFVGYGIQAPEFQWNDFKDADVRGKVLLVMNNDPDHSDQGDADLFAGKTRLYYGRWDYKYEQAARVGAAGVIIIHTTPSAAYPWKVVQTSWSGEQFELPQGDEPRMQLKAWATEDASRRLARLGGQDLDALRAQAERRDFRPVPLGVRLSLKVKNRLNRTKTANVVGRLPGSDPKLAKEAVFFTAHHDHLGIDPNAKPGEDAIYNGAMDNASGVASLLAIARAATALAQPPRRTMYFAAVGAEEQGLLGSEFLAAHPPVPAGRIAAVVNMDAMNIFGRTRDVTVIGLGKSSLDGVIMPLVKRQGRRVTGDAFPDKGSYYRSDQFSFAKVGIPGVYLKGGTDVIGKPEGWGKAQAEAYTEKDYHQPSDELTDQWDFGGMVEDTQLLFRIGESVANAPKAPSWNKGDEFEAIRLKSLQSLRD